MPLIKIDLIKGQRSPAEIKALADVIHKTLIDKFAAPERDRYQIITQHEPYEMICEDTGLGIERSDKLVFIQVFQQGRSREQKQALYAGFAESLERECGLSPKDLIVTVASNTKDDWSFGLGRAVCGRRFVKLGTRLSVWHTRVY